jgi:hypothetical protein
VKDLQHHMFLMTFDSKLVLCPIGEQLNRVLDVGTGTGIWAIDFGETLSSVSNLLLTWLLADEHPEADVLSAIFSFSGKSANVAQGPWYRPQSDPARIVSIPNVTPNAKRK